MRTVRQDIPVDDDFEDACLRWSRTQEAWDMIFWVLARDPTAGDPVSERWPCKIVRVRRVMGPRHADYSSIYVIEEPYVTIKSAAFRDPVRSAGTA